MYILPRVVLLIPRLSSPRTHRSTNIYDSLYNGDIAPSFKTLIKTSDGKTNKYNIMTTTCDIYIYIENVYVYICSTAGSVRWDLDFAVAYPYFVSGFGRSSSCCRYGPTARGHHPRPLKLGRKSSVIY